MGKLSSSASILRVAKVEAFLMFRCVRRILNIEHVNLLYLENRMKPDA